MLAVGGNLSIGHTFRHIFNGRTTRLWAALPIGIVVLASALGFLGSTYAQEPCQQPAPDGCRLPFGQPTRAILSDPGTAHVWRITLDDPGDLRVAITESPVDYRFYIFGPGDVVPRATRVARDGRVTVELSAAPPGDYVAVVDSPNGEASDQPYQIMAVRPGSTLISETFDDPQSGVIAGTSSNPAQLLVGYVGGEYQVRKVDPTSNRVPMVSMPFQIADATLAADVRLEAFDPGAFVVLFCRTQPGDANSGYRIEVMPPSGQFALTRWANRTEQVLAAGLSSAIPAGGGPMHLEITCAGTHISASVDGVELAGVDDDTFWDGQWWIGAGADGGTVDARFDNLVVTQR